jgi:Bacterial Ig-like domain (group 2)
MLHKLWMSVAFFGLALALTACPTTPTPVLSSVTVTAPSSNTLKINEAVQFSAVAKDDNNAVMTGKTFTWLSSDPNVASVDVDGKVTAKQFGTVKITASVEGKSGESASQTTYGLEAIGGTRTSFGSTAIETAFLARFRKPGTPLTGAVPSTLKGPAGWNADKPLEMNYFNLFDGFVQGGWWFGILAKTGTYTLEMTAGGEKFSSSFEIDASKTLASPTSLTLSNVSTTSVTGTWDAVPEATAYTLEIWNSTDNKNAFNQWKHTNTTTATTSGPALDPAKTYYATVHSYTVAEFGGTNAPSFTGILPKQFNVGYKNIKLGAFSSAPMLTLSTRGGLWNGFQDGDKPWQALGKNGGSIAMPVTDAQGRYSVAWGSDTKIFVTHLTLAETKVFDLNQAVESERCKLNSATRDAKINTNFIPTTPTGTSMGIAFSRLTPSFVALDYKNDIVGNSSFQFSVPAGTYDMTAYEDLVDMSGKTAPRTPTKLLRQTLNLPAGETVLNLNFASGVQALENGSSTVNNIPNGWNMYLSSSFFPATSQFQCYGGWDLTYDYAGSITTGSFTGKRYIMPASFYQAGDKMYYVAYASKTIGDLTETNAQINYLAPDQTPPSSVALPSPLNPVTVTATNGIPQANNVTLEFPLSNGYYRMIYVQGNNALLQKISKGWITATNAANIAFPDLTALPEAKATWKLSSGDVSYSVQRISLGSASDTLEFLRDRYGAAATWNNARQTGKITVP